MEEKNDKKVNISLTFSYWVIILFFIVFYIYQSESYKQGYDQITESIHTLYDPAEKGFILPLDGDLSDHSFSEKVASVLKQTYLGLLYREKGEYEEALKPLNLACSLDNSKIYYDKDLASVYYKLAENNKDETTKYTYLKKASIHLESAIRKDAEKLSKYPYAIGLAYWEEKVWKSFIAEHNPSGVIEGDPQLCYSLSQIYYEMKLYDKAKLVIGKAILIKPDPSYHELLSQVNKRINLLNKSLN